MLCDQDEPLEFFEECLDLEECDMELIECMGVLGTCAMIDGLLILKNIQETKAMAMAIKVV